MVKISRSQLDKHLFHKSKFRTYPKLPKFVVKNYTKRVSDPKFEDGRLRAISGIETQGNEATIINSFLSRVDKWDKYHKKSEMESLLKRREHYEQQASK